MLLPQYSPETPLDLVMCTGASAVPGLSLCPHWLTQQRKPGGRAESRLYVCYGCLEQGLRMHQSPIASGLLLGALVKGEEPAEDPRRGGLGMLCAQPLHSAGR